MIAQHYGRHYTKNKCIEYPKNRTLLVIKAGQGYQAVKGL